MKHLFNMVKTHSFCILVLFLAFACTNKPQQSENQKLAVLDSPKAELKEGKGLSLDSADGLEPSGWDTTEYVEPPRLLPEYEKNAAAKPFTWRRLQEGLDYAAADAPLKCKNIGDSKIHILKIDPKLFSFELKTKTEHKADPVETIDKSCERHGLVAAINASMFDASNQYRSVGYCKNFEHFNNKRLGKDKAFIAFNPKKEGLPPFTIIDLGCEGRATRKDDYNTVLQNIRMIDCNRKIRWGKQEKFWSTACMGIDGKGNALFIHSRTPYRVSDFCRMLLQLPLDIRTTCYLEGGPESSLYVKSGDFEVKSFGSYETGFNEFDDNAGYWGIPNIVGVKAR